MMNKRFYYNSVLVCLLLAALIGVTSCVNSEKKAETGSEVAVADSQFSSVDALADNLIEGLWEVKTPEAMEEYYKKHASAVSSYWSINHKGEDESKMNDTVCKDLEALADSLSEGSTADMMRSGEIMCAVARYTTAHEYCTQCADNPLYQAEMRDWLVLEDELVNFYRDLAELANWGGTISRSVAAKTLGDLMQYRSDDFWQMVNGQFDGSASSGIEEARTNFIQELEDAKALPDDTADGDDFRDKLKGMRERADKIVVLLDK